MSKSLLGITGLAVGGIVILSSVFVVPAGQVGVVTTLGKVSKTPRLPGLNIKLPFIQSSHLFSVRTQVVPEKFSTLTKDLQVIEATATVKFAVKPNEAPRIYSTISSSDASIYGRVIQPSLLKSLKSVFSKYELNTIATDWNTISMRKFTVSSLTLSHHSTPESEVPCHSFLMALTHLPTME
jgi:regulator of protease activity HflC (stomatin/prohibitin superfamily)